jgi:membrane protein YdbS with pleckstrin-like domain
MVVHRTTLPRESLLEGSLALKQDEFFRIFTTLLNVFFIPLACYWFINNNWILVSSQVLFILALNIKISLASRYRCFSR